MSLKAKIEAVIYASEEPVTLAQLVGLLGEEAQAELDALAAQQQALALEEGTAEGQEPAEELESVHAEAPAEGAEIVAPVDEEPAEEVAQDAEQGKTPKAEEPAEGGVAPVAEEVPTTPLSAEAPAEGPDTPEPAATEPAVVEIDAKKVAAENKLRERKLREHFRRMLDELVADYANGDRGLEIREVAGGFRLSTKPEYHDAVRGFVKSLKPPLKLSLQALETLAVIAYKQPITAPEISEIRGVDSGGVLGSLLTRKLIQTAGRKQVIGRPMLYKTSKEFLVRFGLKDINELPSIEEFERMASELGNDGAVQEEIPMGDEATTHEPLEDATEAEGTPTSLDEINAAPEPTHVLHDTPEDLMSDRSSSPEGSQREHADPSEVEPNAEVHEAQADGSPDGEESPGE